MFCAVGNRGRAFFCEASVDFGFLAVGDALVANRQEKVDGSTELSR